MSHIGLLLGCDKYCCTRLIASLEKILTLGKAKKKDFSAIFLCFALA